MKREKTLEQQIMEILKYYHYDQYSKNAYFKNCTRKLVELFNNPPHPKEKYEVSYSWITYASDFSGKHKSTEDEIFCAWCRKSQAEIKKTETLEDHINKHVRRSYK